MEYTSSSTEYELLRTAYNFDAYAYRLYVLHDIPLSIGDICAKNHYTIDQIKQLYPEYFL